jgi:hypothetical protein
MAKKDKSKSEESKPINFGRELPIPKSSLKTSQPKPSEKDKKK